MAPFLDGERKPDLPHATGLMAGLTGATGREDLALAALEGLVLGLISGRKALQESGVRLDGRVLAIGGAARLGALTQVLADFDGQVVHGTEVREAVARGAAVQAAAVLSGRPVTAVRDDWSPEAHPLAEPRAGRHQDEVFGRYQVLAGWRGMDTA
jgi:xylulokinase